MVNMYQVRPPLRGNVERSEEHAKGIFLMQQENPDPPRVGGRLFVRLKPPHQLKKPYPAKGLFRKDLPTCV